MQRPSASELYAKLESDRWHFLDRARKCASLTIPHLLPPEGFNNTTEIQSPFQGMGARGVNSLSASLLLALLPPNSPFFRLKVDPSAYQELEGLDEAKAEIDLALSNIEQIILSEIERSSTRTGLYGAVRQLIIAGNALVHFHPEGGIKVYRLTDYVVKRSPDGKPRDVIIKGIIHGDEVPPEVQQSALPADQRENVFDLYTHIQYNSNGKATISQEVGGIEVEGSYQEMDSIECPYLALRMNRIDGEDYGRSMVEEYLGELESLESLSQSIVYGAAASAKVVFLTDPTGMTRPKTLAEAPQLAIREGRASDVTVLQVQKGADFATAFQAMGQITDRLSNAFLLAEGTIRQAERVTAAEIRLISDSLERQLGGTYSLLSQELQLPMVRLVMLQMKKRKQLPAMPKDIIEPVIVTGVQALGRSTDSLKLDTFMGAALQQLGPDVLMSHLHMDEWFTRKAASLGLDSKGLIKTQEEIQAEQQQQMQQQLAMQAGSAGINVGAQQAMDASQPQPEETDV